MGNIAGQEVPAANIGPGNMDELLHDNRRMVLADHVRCKVEMVVMQHHDGGAIFSFNLCDYSVSNGPVGNVVTVRPGVLNSTSDRRIFIRIKEIMFKNQRT